MGYKKQEINEIRVCYNDKFVIELKKRIYRKKKKLTEQKRFEKEAKIKLEKLLKL